jgi:hypothetical protein
MSREDHMSTSDLDDIARALYKKDPFFMTKSIIETADLSIQLASEYPIEATELVDELIKGRRELLAQGLGPGSRIIQ